MRVKVAKNKVAAPFTEAEFDIDFGRGISQVGCVLDLAVEHGVVAKKGAFFSFGEEKLGQGRANAKEFLEARPEAVEAIAREVRERLAGAGATTAVDREGDPPSTGRSPVASAA